MDYGRGSPRVESTHVAAAPTQGRGCVIDTDSRDEHQRSDALVENRAGAARAGK